MNLDYDPRYPCVDDLRDRARRRIPRFAFEYQFMDATFSGRLNEQLCCQEISDFPNHLLPNETTTESRYEPNQSTSENEP